MQTKSAVKPYGFHSAWQTGFILLMRSFKGNGIHSSILVEHLFLYEKSDGKLS